MGLDVISISYCCWWSYRKIDHSSFSLLALQWNFSEVPAGRHFGFSPPCEWTLEPSLLYGSHDPLRFSEIFGSLRSFAGNLRSKVQFIPDRESNKTSEVIYFSAIRLARVLSEVPWIAADFLARNVHPAWKFFLLNISSPGLHYTVN